jgi:hypothetical protein
MRVNLKIDKKTVFLWVGLLFILLLECTIKWIGDLFGRINLDEVSLMMQIGAGGVDAEIMASFVRKVICPMLTHPNAVSIFSCAPIVAIY